MKRPSFYWFSFGTWGICHTGITGHWERVYLTRKTPRPIAPGNELKGEIIIGPTGAFQTSRWTPIIRHVPDRKEP